MSNANKGYGGATSSSRRVYILRRMAGGLVLIGLLHLIFASGEYRSITADIIMFVAAALLWLLSNKLNRPKNIDPDRFDENGNAKKRVL